MAVSSRLRFQRTEQVSLMPPKFSSYDTLPHSKERGNSSVVSGNEPALSTAWVSDLLYDVSLRKQQPRSG